MGAVTFRITFGQNIHQGGGRIQDVAEEITAAQFYFSSSFFVPSPDLMKTTDLLESSTFCFFCLFGFVCVDVCETLHKRLHY